jgi:toxin-antitoxin system PIN domain toxin
MRLVDANVLLYAVNADAEHHAASKTWLDAGLSGRESIGLAWVPLLAFIRLSTNPALFPRPLSAGEAMDQVEGWLGARRAVAVNPTARHAFLLNRLLREVGSGGNLVNDAHLATLALEHRAQVVTYDTDFSRFEGVGWRRPDDLL